MGGLSRKSTYIKSLKSNKINPIILDAGDALFASPQYPTKSLPREKYKAKAFLQAFDEIGCDAINIGEFDLAAGYKFLKSLEKNSTSPFISANLREKVTGNLAFKPYVLIERNGLKIGVIGVTDHIPSTEGDLIKDNYLKTGQKMISKLKIEVDIIIMMVNGDISKKAAILESFKDADYLFLSRSVSNTRITAPQEDEHPIFYTFGINGKYLAEIKSTVKDNTKSIIDVSSDETNLSNIKRQLSILKATEGKQTVAEKYANNPQVLTQIEFFEKRAIELENSLSKVVNKSEINLIALPLNMDYDTKIQSFIDKELGKAKKL